MPSIYRRPYNSNDEKDKNVLEADNGGGADQRAAELNAWARQNAQRASQQYAQEHQTPAVPTYSYVPSTFGYQYGYKPTQFTYNSQYADLINAASDRLRNWNYDPNSDVSYNAYKNQYTRGGQQAMTDALARYASRTGGVASSYAASAAQQQYNNYMQQLAAKVPELEQLAYGRAVDELEYYTNADNTAYGRAFNEYADWEDRRRQQADTDYEIAYRAWQSSENAREAAARNAYNAALAEWEAKYGDSGNTKTTNKTTIKNDTIIKPSGKVQSLATNEYGQRIAAQNAAAEEARKVYEDNLKKVETNLKGYKNDAQKVQYLEDMLKGDYISTDQFNTTIDMYGLRNAFDDYQTWKNRRNRFYDTVNNFLDWPNNK